MERSILEHRWEQEMSMSPLRGQAHGLREEWRVSSAFPTVKPIELCYRHQLG